MDNKYFISAFLEAAKNSMFQHRWMPAETWAALINHYYKPPINLILDSQNLLRAITSAKWLHTALETNGNIDSELNLYRNRYRPKGAGKQIWCFYSAPSGAKPTIKEKPWFNYINYAEKLLNLRVTRTNTLQLTTEIASEADLVHTRKRKKPQTQEICENKWNASKPLEENKVSP